MFLLKSKHPPTDIVKRFLERHKFNSQTSTITTSANGILAKSKSFRGTCKSAGYSVDTNEFEFLWEDQTEKYLPQTAEWTNRVEVADLNQDGRIDLLFANTESTYLPKEQLDRICADDIRPGSILFIHHPTREVSGGFMDLTYPLKNWQAVHAALDASNIKDNLAFVLVTETQTSFPLFAVHREKGQRIPYPPAG